MGEETTQKATWQGGLECVEGPKGKEASGENRGQGKRADGQVRGNIIQRAEKKDHNPTSICKRHSGPCVAWVGRGQGNGRDRSRERTQSSGLDAAMAFIKNDLDTMEFSWDKTCRFGFNMK